MARAPLSDEKIKERVLDRDWPQAQQFKQNYNEDAIKGYRRYKNWKDPQISKLRQIRGRADVQIAKFAEFVETKVPRYVESLFANAPEYVVMLPRTPEDESAAPNATVVMNYWLERDGIVVKMASGLKEACFAGTSVFMPSWVRKDMERQRWVTFAEYLQTTGQMPEERYWTDELRDLMAAAGNAPSLLPPEVLQAHRVPMRVVDTEEGPRSEQVPFIDFYVDPRAKNFLLDGARYAIRRFRATRRELEEVNASLKAKGLPPRYKNLDKLDPQGGSTAYTDGQSEYYRAIGHTAPNDYVDGTHDFLEYWDTDTNWVYTLANEMELVRTEAWPHWHGRLPFVLFCPIPDVHSPFGIPLWLWIADELEDLSETARAARDLMNLLLDPPMFVNEAAVVDPFHLDNIRPGKKIPLEVMNGRVQDAVYLYPMPQTWPAAQQDIQSISQRLNDVTGLQAPIRGAPISRRTTVGETQMLVEEGSARLKMDIRILNESFKALANHFYWLGQQFAPDTLTVRIEGQATDKVRFAEVNKDNIDRNFDIYPASSSIEALANRGLQAQALGNFLQLISGTPAAQAIDWVEMGRTSLHLLGIRHAARLLPEANAKLAQVQAALQDQQLGPQVMQMAMQMQQQMMAQQAPPLDPAQAQSGAATPEQQMGISPDEMAQRENEQLLLGQEVPVDPGQDHQTHLQFHQMAFDAGQAEGQDMTALVQHAQQHMQYLEGSNGQAAGGPVPAGRAAAPAPV